MRQKKKKNEEEEKKKLETATHLEGSGTHCRLVSSAIWVLLHFIAEVVHAS